MRRIVASFLFLVAASIVIAGGYLYWIGNMHLTPRDGTYIVEPGTSLRRLNKDLYREGLLPDPYSLQLLARIKGQSRELKAGEYRFRNGITPPQVLAQIIAGRVVEYPVLIVEGWTFRQVLAALDSAPKLTHTLRNMKPQEIMRRLDHPDVHPEGRFFPDTYYYSRGTTDLQILQSAFRKMDTLLANEWDGRDPTLPFSKPEEALTLASIVEKETGHVDERRLIAGVFINRLKRRMKLQTDPTVIYGMGERYRGNIRLVDLRRDTLYNTYTRYGLPPTPIAMPGADAVRAVLHPAQTQALYFVSRGDGTHVFSDNLKDHNAAVIQYQLHGRARPFSSHPQPIPAESP